MCQKCCKLYKYQGCFMLIRNEKVTKKCNFRAFPNHKMRRYRATCGADLLKSVTSPSERRVLVPHKIYWYKSIKESLAQLVKREGFEKSCEKWRERNVPDNVYEDIYDGKIWKEFSYYFNSKDGKSPGKRYGLMLNLDWFNPFKHASYSVGALYLVCLNLPRSERFKRKNVILVGIIPHMKTEPKTNTFLEPLADELVEGWQNGFKLSSANFRPFKKNFFVALLCVGCDVPACRKLCGFLGNQPHNLFSWSYNL